MNRDTDNRARSPRQAGGAVRRAAPWTLAAAAGLLLATGAKTGAGLQDEVGDTRQVLEEWVEVRSTIAQERKDWQLGREVLGERIELVRSEVEALREKTAAARESIAEADDKRAERFATNEELKATIAAVQEPLEALEQRVKELLPRLPEPIRDRVKPLSQQITLDPDETRLSMGARYQNVVGILNEVDKFNREITVTSERRELPDGTSAEVTAVYVGVGQGYYVSSNGEVAGTGRGSIEGWTWSPANDAAAEIAQVIAILKKEQVAAFVPLPVRAE